MSRSGCVRHDGSRDDRVAGRNDWGRGTSLHAPSTRHTLVPVSATPVVDATLLAALRADLTAADFTVDAVAASLGPVAEAALRREQALPADLFTRARRDSLSILVRLLTLGRPVAVVEVDAALPTLGTDGLLGLGSRRGRVARSGRAATCGRTPTSPVGGGSPPTRRRWRRDRPSTRTTSWASGEPR